MQHDYVFPTGKKVRAPSDKLNSTFIKGLPDSLEGEAGKLIIISDDETSYSTVDPTDIEVDSSNVLINEPIAGLDSTNVYDALAEVVLLSGGSESTIDTQTDAIVTLTTASSKTQLIDCTIGNVTVNLPECTGNDGLAFDIKKIDATSNTVTLNPNGSEKIDGQDEIIITLQYVTITIKCDGSNWFII